ncbi:MAG: TonB-dependent receptor [Bacteroidales bacterium]|nr:TonB-dependent receptor [Bacteroidales bacterium]
MNLKHIKYICFSTLTLLLTHNLVAQSPITGIVLDEQGEPLVGANIYLTGTYDGTTSNSKGLFQLFTDEYGNQVLRIDFVGFEPYTHEVTLNGTPIQLSEVTLKESFNELTAVTITAGTFEAGDKKKSIALSSLDMVTTAGAAGDVFGALQALPGTTTVGESGKLFIKGGDSRESRTFIDGTLVYVPYSSSSPNNSVRGRFSPFMFSGTMFSTGGYSAEFGQALSSVLSLQTNAMPVQDHLNISLLSVGAELGGTKTWENASVTSSINYENLSPYMRLFPQYRTWEKEPQGLSGDVSFRLKTGKSGMLKFYANAGKSRLTIVENNLNNPGTTYTYSLLNDNYYINGSWIGEIATDWIMTTAFSYTNNTDDVSIDSLQFNEQLTGTHAKVMIKHKLNERTKIIAGTELYTKEYRVEFPFQEQSTGTHEFVNHTLTGFLEGEIYASSKFITRLGTRFEYSDYLGKASLSPRISSAYILNKKSQVSLSYGWFFQDPEDEFLLYTNNFSFERADHYTLNFLMNGDRRMLRTELYYKDYKQLVKYQISETNEYNYIDNSGYGHAWGVDLFWRDRKSVKNAEYWISYSYINALRNYLIFPYETVPDFSASHNLTLVYKHWFSKLRSQIGGTYRFTSPRYYNNPNLEAFNSEKTMPYQSLDANWSYLHKPNVIFYFSVSNLLGFEQEFGHKYASIPDSEGVYYSAPKLPGSRRFFIMGCFITLSKSGEINQIDKIN